MEAVFNAGNEQDIQALLQSVGDAAQSGRDKYCTENQIFALAPSSLKADKPVESRRLAARAIGNLCFEHARNRALFLSSCPSLPSLLVDALSAEDPQLLRNVSACIANLVAETEEAQSALVTAGAVPSLLKVCYSFSSRDDVLHMALKALNNLSDHAPSLKYFDDNSISFFSNSLSASSTLLRQAKMQLIGILTGLLAEHPTLLSDVLASSLISLAAGKGSKVGGSIQKTSADLIQTLLDKDAARPKIVQPHGFEPFLPLLYQSSGITPNLASLSINKEEAKEEDDDDEDDDDEEGVKPEIKASKLQVQLWGILAGMALHDPSLGLLWEQTSSLLSSALQSSENNHDVLVSILMALGNLARSEDICSKIVTEEDGKIVQSLLRYSIHPTNQRIQHMSLGAVRNLSISGTGKRVLVSSGVIPVILQHLTNRENPNILIQYAAVGIARSCMMTSEESALAFTQAGIIPALVNIAKGELTPDVMEVGEEGGDSTKQKDHRVEYEAARLLARLLEAASLRQEAIKAGSIPCVLSLLNTPYPLLQSEAVKTVHSLMVGGESATLTSCNAEASLRGFLSVNSGVNSIADIPSDLSALVQACLRKVNLS